MRRRAIVVAAAVLAFAVVVGGSALLRSGGAGADPAAATDSGVAGDASPARSAEPAAPLALAQDSEYVETELLGGERLRVEHWVSSSRPLDRLRLTVPDHPGLDDTSLEIDGLRVVADGRGVDVRAGEDAVELAGASRLYVEYELAGAVSSAGSVADRALATVTALDLGTGRALSRTQVFPGRQVMTLACLAEGADAVPAPCGALDDTGWQVESATDRTWDTVIAQFDLTSRR